MDFADMNMVAVSTDNAVDVVDVDDDDEWDEETRSQKDHELLAQRETKALRLLRALLGLTLLVSTALASWLVFRFMRRAEQRTMLSELTNYAGKVIHAVQGNADRRIQGIDALSVALTSYAKSVDANWPFVTVPDFGILEASALAIAHATYAVLLPIITDTDRSAWEKYSVENQGRMSQSSEIWVNSTEEDNLVTNDVTNTSSNISHFIFEFSQRGPMRSAGPGPFLPFWQTAPPNAISSVASNFNSLSLPNSLAAFKAAMDSRQAVLSELLGFNVTESGYKDYGLKFTQVSPEEPHSNVLFPVFNKFTPNRKLVAFLVMDFSWGGILKGILPTGTYGIDTVVENTCGQSMTYQIRGRKAVFLGLGDLHDRSYDFLVTALELNNGFTDLPDSVKVNTMFCPYTVRLYPSRAFHEGYITRKPIIMTVVVIAIFGFTSLVFFTYDRLVETRQTKVMDSAIRSNRIVSSMFPSNVRDRVFQINDPLQPTLNRRDHGTTLTFKKTDEWTTTGDTPKHQLQRFLRGRYSDQPKMAPKPIADLFLNATVLFADISGFTAWGSARDPSQVFTLLEAVYNAFDKIAKRKGVFKVETIGDCYMAVTGLPEPQEHHAVLMAEFAEECLVKMKDVVRKLELTLGPDTADLSLRIGIHSGPVTAGVLRNEKSRFQLFGDTVNTASRMESTGQMDRIHISSTSAMLLHAAGKKDWTVPRDDKVFAKGKGEMNTFWLESNRATKSIGRSTASTEHTCDSPAYIPGIIMKLKSARIGYPERQESQVSLFHSDLATDLSKLTRIISWNAEVLQGPLKAIIAYREIALRRRGPKGGVWASLKRRSDGTRVLSNTCTILDEVVETIALPRLDYPSSSQLLDGKNVELKSDVKAQLLNFVSSIASLYQRNPFHSFQHASHVTMSANKLLQRIVAMDNTRTLQIPQKRSRKHGEGSGLDDNSFGIASDPLVQFAILFAALIHDVDHPGIPNKKLVEMGTEVAIRYQNKSVAEQNSVTIAWALLMTQKYDELRNCIASTEDELQRFRQLVVNLVMATDVHDKDLQESRRRRWNEAFHDISSHQELATRLSKNDVANRKATIVIEHIIQASDVAHTMQHWQIFTRWNENLFREKFTRYLSGDDELDPSIEWFQRELDFFDGYIIPLANKLKECGVFGVSGDEYLSYALENRREWVQQGEMIVGDLVSSCQQKLQGEDN